MLKATSSCVDHIQLYAIMQEFPQVMPRVAATLLVCTLLVGVGCSLETRKQAVSAPDSGLLRGQNSFLKDGDTTNVRNQNL